MSGWFWVAVFFAGIITSLTVWTVWGSQKMRDRYYATRGVPPTDM